MRNTSNEKENPMSDPRIDDPAGSGLDESGLDKGTGDPNDDRAYLNDMPPAQVAEDAGEDVDSDETDADA